MFLTFRLVLKQRQSVAKNNWEVSNLKIKPIPSILRWHKLPINKVNVCFPANAVLVNKF